jgi:hypothetical protein
MPRTAAAIFAMLLLASAASAQQSSQLSSRDVRALVNEYCQPATTEDRRTEIVTALHARSTPVVTSGALSSALGGRSTDTALAIELVGRLRHERAWPLLRRYVDDDALRTDAVAALFAAGTNDALEQLQSRWASEPVDSELYFLLNASFRAAQPTADLLRRFVLALDGDRSDDAAAILCAMLRLPSTAEREQIEQAAAQMRQRLALLATSFRLEGRNIGELAEAGNALRHRGNLLLDGQTATFSGLGDVQEQAHTVRLRFQVVDDGEGTAIGYTSGQGTWQITIINGEAVLRHGDSTTSTAPIRSGWNEIEWRVWPDDSGRRQSRLCRVSINGTELVQRSTFNGELRQVFVRARGVVAIGGWEMIER